MRARKPARRVLQNHAIAGDNASLDDRRTAINRRTALLAIGTGWLGLVGSLGACDRREPPSWTTPSATAASSTGPGPSAAPSSPAPADSTTREPRTAPPAVTIEAPGWHSWAMMDRRTGDIVGSDNGAELNETASMIKAWLAADYLRRAAHDDREPESAKLSALSTMIRDSANDPATEVYAELGWSASISRMNDICGLAGAEADGGWGSTRMSAQDACRLAHSIGTGVAAGPRWTDWLVGEMRQVRGTGDFGIRKAFPGAERETIAIKNGWVVWSAAGVWTVNCLALAPRWAMAVLSRYPAGLGMAHGAAVAESVAAQLIAASSLPRERIGMVRIE